MQICKLSCPGPQTSQTYNTHQSTSSLQHKPSHISHSVGLNKIDNIEDGKYRENSHLQIYWETFQADTEDRLMGSQ